MGLIRLGLSSGLVSTLSLNYERVFNNEVSAALTVGRMVPRRPDGLFDIHTDNIDPSSDRELQGRSFTPEVKWYLERNDVRPAPCGFYVGMYGRLSDVRLTSDLTGAASSTEINGTVEGSLQLDLLEYGLGIDAGYQLLTLNDRLAIDFVFFGPRWSLHTLKVEVDLSGDGVLPKT